MSIFFKLDEALKSVLSVGARTPAGARWTSGLGGGGRKVCGDSRTGASFASETPRSVR